MVGVFQCLQYVRFAGVCFCGGGCCGMFPVRFVLCVMRLRVLVVHVGCVCDCCLACFDIVAIRPRYVTRSGWL